MASVCVSGHGPDLSRTLGRLTVLKKFRFPAGVISVLDIGWDGGKGGQSKEESERHGLGGTW